MFTRRLINQVLKQKLLWIQLKIIQTKTGIAMGTRMAPSYANMFMKYLEKYLLEIYKKTKL